MHKVMILYFTIGYIVVFSTLFIAIWLSTLLCTIQIALSKMYLYGVVSKKFKLFSKDQLEMKVYRADLSFKFRKGNSPIISTSLGVT